MTIGVEGENNFVFDDMSNLHAFLPMTEFRKAICDMPYCLNKDSNTLNDLAQVWNVDKTISRSYLDDYDIINNRYSSCHQTAWTDKYTTVLFDKQTPTEFQWKQPVADYIH